MYFMLNLRKVCKSCRIL